MKARQVLSALERTVLCVSPAGLHRMAYREWGEPENPRVLVCVHGLSRNGRDFDTLAKVLARDYRVICPDVVGRGQSDWLRDPSCYTLPQYVADMIVLIARADVGKLHWLGTSMGGLIGMLLAAHDNSPITRLLLNDVGPIIPAAAIARIGANFGQTTRFPTIADAEAYLRRVNAPFGELSDRSWRQITESSLRQRADGSYEMRYDPAIVGAFRRETAADIDLWPVYDRLRCQTLVVRGAESDLLSEATAGEMTRRGPQAQCVEVPCVGHAPMFMNGEQIEIARQFFLAPG